MTRHGRNSTNSAVYTYHERKKDASASGYGSENCRLGKDSLKGKLECTSISKTLYVRIFLKYFYPILNLIYLQAMIVAH